jgi:hypothetical protein
VGTKVPQSLFFVTCYTAVHIEAQVTLITVYGCSLLVLSFTATSDTYAAWYTSIHKTAKENSRTSTGQRWVTGTGSSRFHACQFCFLSCPYSLFWEWISKLCISRCWQNLKKCHKKPVHITLTIPSNTSVFILTHYMFRPHFLVIFSHLNRHAMQSNITRAPCS